MTTQVGIATAWHDERRRDRATGKVIAVACLEGWAVFDLNGKEIAGSRAVRDLAARRAADLVLISLGYELEGGAFGEAEAMAAQAKTAAIVAILDAVGPRMTTSERGCLFAVLAFISFVVFLGYRADAEMQRAHDARIAHQAEKP